MFRILSLDGGGSWALLQAMALKEIYKNRPQKNNCKLILDDFQLVVSNSGGSIMLAAMIEFDTIDEVIQLFLNEEKRKLLFSKLKRKEKTCIEKIAGLLKIGPKYSTERKLSGLKAVLKNYANKNLHELPIELKIQTQFMIMGYDYDRQRSVYFRSKNDSPNSSSPTSNVPSDSIESPKSFVSLASAVHASCNAPVNYFNEPAQFKYQGFERRFWDGGIGGNNNPCLIGVTEAMGQGALPNEIELRSIGTGVSFLPIKGQTIYKAQDSVLIQSPEKQSLDVDLKKMAMSILCEPPDAATYISHIVLGGKAVDGSTPMMVRLNPVIQPVLENNTWQLPKGFDSNKFKQLTQLELDAIEQNDIELIKYLGEQWIANTVKNQPIRMDTEKLECQIGYDYFSKGADKW